MGISNIYFILTLYACITTFLVLQTLAVEASSSLSAAASPSRSTFSQMSDSPRSRIANKHFRHSDMAKCSSVNFYQQLYIRPLTCWLFTHLGGCMNQFTPDPSPTARSVASCSPPYP